MVTMSIEPMMVLAILRSANIKTIKYLAYLMFLFSWWNVVLHCLRL